eukprot:CAMPEP_0177612188 /NCGR_PEP_ID=MMETSP0419_2-20121207/21039_1 /TAXON_ID=582737 /ORGANISM="Tetraselmis sp., Strain GSL018" /LENGTH=1045 /DNA_ID=CAMNT_0019108263 /DNA_START=510 /DNA_END=3647 /DNA_ORIENTATION=+
MKDAILWNELSQELVVTLREAAEAAGGEIGWDQLYSTELGTAAELLRTLSRRSRSRIDQVQLLSCPAGSFCPTPLEKHDCHPGSYCPMAAVTNTSCNMPRLMLRRPMEEIRFVMSESIMDRIFHGKQVIQGNFCPAGSEKPSGECPAGFYCPTVSKQIECPEGYYCPKGSTSPASCPWLSACPKGSTGTSYSWAGFITGAVIIGALAGLILVGNAIRSHLYDKNKRAVRRQERFNEIINCIKLPPRKFFAFEDIDRVSIEFENLTLDLKSGTRVLDGVSGSFPHSQLIAIMGGSGCGKSTFLNVLCGKATYGTMGGRVLINGEAVPLSFIRSIKGFVPQDDTVHEDLTVQENLYYSAAARLPSRYTRYKRKQLVLATCELLELSPVINSVVGSVEHRGISGGQRKRVNIGVELVAQPSVLFLDEPTSGLDATASLSILSGLKLLSQRGLSSIMVIHQPRYSVFELFDQVLLLGAGGHQVYLGPSSLALPYFESKGFSLPPNENPADFFLDIIQGKISCGADGGFEVTTLYDWWRKSGREWVAGAAEARERPRAETEPEAPPLTAGQSLARISYHEQTIKERFNLLDKNNDGCVTPMEIVEFIKDNKKPCTLEEARHVLKAITGSRYEATLDDFLAYSIGSNASASASQSADLPAADAPAADVEHGKAKEEEPLSRSGPGKLPSMRHTANPFKQAWLIFRRSANKWTRSWNLRIIDICLVMSVAIIIGGIQGSNWNMERVGVNLILYLIALGVIITTASLRVFGSGRVVHWREVSSGYSVVAVFMGTAAFDFMDVTLRPLLFSAMFWSLTATPIPFKFFFGVSWLSSWWSSGLGYLLSVVIPEDNAVLAGAAIPLVLAGFFNGFNPTLSSFGALSPMHLLTYLSFARWATESLMVKYFQGSDIQFRVMAVALMRGVGFCNAVFEDPSSGPNDPNSGMLEMVMTVARNPETQPLVTNIMRMLFPSVYQASNLTEIRESFDRDCKAIHDTDLQESFCSELDQEANSAFGYTECLASMDLGLLVLFIEGLLLRVLALVALKFMNRGKQI